MPSKSAIAQLVVASAATLGLAPGIAQNDIEATRKALGIIDEFARSMCTDPDLKGSTTSASANAKASAGVSKLVKSLADAKVDLSADFKRESFQGLLRTDLLEATKNTTTCRLTIFKDLKDRVLPKKASSVSPPAVVQKVPALPPPAKPEPPKGNETGQSPSLGSSAKHFARLLDISGLPPTAKIKWGTPFEEIEKLIPSQERSISRTDAIGFADKVKLNDVPATTVILFENRRLTGIRLEFSASYSEDRRGHMIDKSVIVIAGGGDRQKAEPACSDKYLEELVKRLDGSFSKTSDLSCKHSVRDVPSSSCQAASNCQSKDVDTTCKAAYKHSEAAQITMSYKYSTSKESYVKGAHAYWSNGASCTLELLFRDEGVKAAGI